MHITKIRQNIIAADKSNAWVLIRQRYVYIYDDIQINLKRYIVNNTSKMRKFKMAAISLYKNYKCSYLHPQMRSV